MAVRNVMFPNFIDVPFNASEPFTVGLELELQLLDKNTRELFSGAPKLLQKLYPDKAFKAELFQSMIEINTEVAPRLHEIEKTLVEKIEFLKLKSERFNIEIMMNGTHPRSDWHIQKVTQSERYLRLAERIQWLVKRFTIFGLHVHVGIADADTAIKIQNHLLYYIPHLIAMSASSPIWNGEVTGLASTRSKIFEALPNAGMPPYLKNWKEFEILANQLLRSNSIDSIRDIWWDIRPHSRFGTLEIRVCDAMPTLKENIAVAAFIHCLVKYIHDNLGSPILPAQLPQWILSENKWRATRYGSDAHMIIDHYGTSQPLRVNVQKLIRILQPYARDYNYQEYFTFLEKNVLKGVPSQRQLGIYQKNKNLDDIISHIINEFNNNEPKY
ncbi:MAG: YbdK family carboxylate-amine ligase [Calditrichia bacterium]|nr:YbdK family carboxylate-amine ligase [Calditrichia bacterium]